MLCYPLNLQVLSAAHCWRNDTEFVTLGVNKIKLEQNEAAEFSITEHIPIATSIKHSSYSGEDGNFDYDFWMIKLQWASSLYPTVDVNITSQLNLNNDDQLYAMGFGRLAENGHSSNVMQKVMIKYCKYIS